MVSMWCCYLLLYSQPVQQLHHLYLAGEIEKSRRLVQIDDGSLLGQCFGYHDLLTFAVTQRMDHPVLQLLYSY